MGEVKWCPFNDDHCFAQCGIWNHQLQQCGFIQHTPETGDILTYENRGLRRERQRLIELNTDLLKALKAMVTSCGCITDEALDALDKTEQAIAKAEGEGR